MPSAAIPGPVLAAARRYGPSVDRIAAQYRNPVTGGKLTGTALLLKLSQGESGFRGDAVSSAGARGWTQFTAGTRQAVLQKFGIDPWRSPDEAFHAAALHLQGRVNGTPGLHGYNPGDPGYTDYILGQRIGRGASSGAGGAPGGTAYSAPSSSGVPASPEVGGAGLAAILAQLDTSRQPRPTAPLQAPAFSAHPTLPVGAPQIPSVAPAQRPGDALASVLAQVAASGAADASSAAGAPGAASGATSAAAPMSSHGLAAVARLKGVAHFDGKPVAAWIAPVLSYARDHGWKGSVNSGYRTVQEQAAIYNRGVRPAAKPGQSNHNFTAYPGGAIDATDAQQLAEILRNSPYRNLLVWAGSKDPVHFSHPHNGSY